MISLNQTEINNSSSSSFVDFQDTIATISWRTLPYNPSQFVCASWDSKISLVEVVHPMLQNPTIRCKFSRTMEYPCIAVSCQPSSDKIIAGSINGDIHLIEGEGQASTRIGSHDDAVKYIHFASQNMIYSVSYDKTMRFWDNRRPDAIHSMNLGAKPTCCDFGLLGMAIGLEDGRIGVLYERDFSSFFGRSFEGHFKKPATLISDQLSCISMGRENKIQVGSHDGISTVLDIEPDQGGGVYCNMKASFMAHKLLSGEGGNTSDKIISYPVNAVGLNSILLNVCFSAGRNGEIRFFDYIRNGYLGRITNNNIPVSDAKMSPCGKYLAYATGYDWSIGIEGDKRYKSQLKIVPLKQFGQTSHLLNPENS